MSGLNPRLGIGIPHREGWGIKKVTPWDLKRYKTKSKRGVRGGGGGEALRKILFVSRGRKKREGGKHQKS